MVEIKQGERDVTEREQLTLEVRRDCDREYLRRASAFMRAKAAAGVPFFVYFNHSLTHMLVVPRQEFEGSNGQGPWADSLLELDSDFGTLLDLLDLLGIADTTVVVFAGDNGPEEVLLWRGTPGYWEGSYLAGGEGNLRTPCMVRWPGRIPAGQVSDDIMHVTDWSRPNRRARLLPSRSGSPSGSSPCTAAGRNPSPKSLSVSTSTAMGARSWAEDWPRNRYENSAISDSCPNPHRPQTTRHEAANPRGRFAGRDQIPKPWGHFNSGTSWPGESSRRAAVDELLNARCWLSWSSRRPIGSER
jgi:hypothetical protein